MLDKLQFAAWFLAGVLISGSSAWADEAAEATAAEDQAAVSAEVESDADLATAQAETEDADASHDEADHGDGDHGDGDHAAGDHAAGGHGAEGDAAAGDPLQTDPDLAIWTLVIFAALLVVLRVFAWDPIVQALQAREAGITGEIEAAAAKHEEAKALLAEHSAKIASATDEVKAMLDEARRDAEQTKTQIVEEARNAASAEKARAIREVEHARDSAIKQLAEESAHLAIDLASKVVKQDISSQRQGEIVSEAINRLNASRPSNN